MSLNILEQIALILLGAAVLLSLVRLLIGPTAPDRLVATDNLSVITTVWLVVAAAIYNSPLYLDVAVIYGTLAFVGVVAIARAIEGNKT